MVNFTQYRRNGRDGKLVFLLLLSMSASVKYCHTVTADSNLQWAAANPTGIIVPACLPDMDRMGVYPFSVSASPPFPRRPPPHFEFGPFGFRLMNCGRGGFSIVSRVPLLRETYVPHFLFSAVGRKSQKCTFLVCLWCSTIPLDTGFATSTRGHSKGGKLSIQLKWWD